MTGTDWTSKDQEALAEKLAPFAISGLGLAVSGGSDSLAMLYLCVAWAKKHGAVVKVATVDHGLRKEAHAEAEKVAHHCKTLGVPHSILEWRGWDRKGNLQAEARKARIDLLTEWAKSEGLSNIALAHTMDDVAETFLMRLGRGAGATGLARMSQAREVNGVTIARPLLDARRLSLRAYLEEQGIAWIDDPSNRDKRFDRVKLREILPALEEAGVAVPNIAQSAENLRDVATALDFYVLQAARMAVSEQDGGLWINSALLDRHPKEVQRRLFALVVQWLSPSEYPPRGKAVEQLMAQVATQDRAVLQGCLFSHRHDALLVTREFNAVDGMRAPFGETWDGNWRLLGTAPEGAVTRALGEDGLRSCPNWRDTGRPRDVLIVSPSVWIDDAFYAAPLAGEARGIAAEPQKHWEDFLQSLLSH